MTIDHEDRRTGIGGSQIAALLPKKYHDQLFINQTPLALYHYIVNGICTKDNPHFATGRQLEAAILSEYEDQESEKDDMIAAVDNAALKDEMLSRYDAGLKRDIRLTSSVNPIFKCQLDGWLPNKKRVVDAKTTHHISPYLSNGGMPANYRCQLQWCMGISDAVRGDLIIKVLGGKENKYINRTCLRDDDIINYLRKKAVDFWRYNIESRIPPEPINKLDYIKFVGKRFITIESEKVQKLVDEYISATNPDMRDLVRICSLPAMATCRLKDVIKALGQTKADVLALIKDELNIKEGEKFEINRMEDGRAVMIINSYVVSKKSYRVDIDALEQATNINVKDYIYQENNGNPYRVARINYGDLK